MKIPLFLLLILLLGCAPDEPPVQLDYAACFNLQDVVKCQQCLGSIQDSCIARYDYQSEASDEYGYTDKIITQKDLDFVRANRCERATTPTPTGTMNMRSEVLDIVPAWNSFINEGCNTTWDNLTAIRVNNSWLWWSQIPEWTADPEDIDRQRFTFFWEVANPYNEIDPLATDPTRTRLETGWYLLPVSHYGNQGQVCMGTQKLHLLILDELTGTWYRNEMITQASYLCGGQSDCDFGFSVLDVQYANYQTGFLYVVDTPVFNQ